MYEVKSSDILVLDSPEIFDTSDLDCMLISITDKNRKIAYVNYPARPKNAAIYVYIPFFPYDDLLSVRIKKDKIILNFERYRVKIDGILYVDITDKLLKFLKTDEISEALTRLIVVQNGRILEYMSYEYKRVKKIPVGIPGYEEDWAPPYVYKDTLVVGKWSIKLEEVPGWQ